MFLPLRDANPSRKFPKVTIALIVLNIAVFAFQVLLDNRVLMVFACVPDRIMALFSFKLFNIIYLPGLFTHQFLHGGLLHLLGNLLFLWVFGDNVEDYLGHKKFLRFYLYCGALAAMSHVLMNPNSPIPMIGASGAISGVLGAYFLLYPKAKVTTLILVFPYKLPAAIFLGVWFAIQIIYSIALPADSGIAWYAHIGGFIVGFVLVKIMKKRR